MWRMQRFTQGIRSNTVKDWKPVDMIVAGLAIGVMVVLILPLINMFIHGSELSDTKTKMIIGLVSSIASIISLYVGSKIGRP